MSDYAALSKTELIGRLEALQARHGDAVDGASAWDPTQALEICRISLELKSRELEEARSTSQEGARLNTELYDRAPVGYLTFDGEGRIHALNVAAATMLGWPRDRLQGQLLGGFLEAGQDDLLHQCLRRVLDGNTKQTFNLRLKNQTALHLECIAADTHRCRAAMFDITQRLEMERRLADREARLQGILATAADGIITIDTQGIVQSFNPAAERIFGYRAEEVVGRNVGMLMPEPYRSEHDSYIRRYRQTREPHIIGIGREVQGRRKDGSVFPLDLAVGETWDHAVAYTGIVRDITARKAAERALRESEERFRQIAEHIREVFWIWDLGCNYIVYVSPMYETVWGRSSRALYENPGDWREAIHPEDRERVEVAIERSRRDFTFDQQYRIVCDDGTVRWIHDRGFPVRNADGRVFRLAGIAEDVTEAREAQSRLQEMHGELVHLARISLANEMATGLAHELNQPLTAVVTYAQLCRQMLEFGTVAPEQLAELMDKIAEQGRRGSDIIIHLRRLVGTGKTTKEITDINELLREVGRLAEIQATRHDIRLRFQLHDPLPMVSVNSVQIQQVVLNLISNAIDAMRETDTDRVLTLSSAPRPELPGVEVSLSDNGTGLSPDAGEQLFDTFFTTKTDGMGLGLSLCRSIIGSHKGRIWVTPNQDRGVTFHFTLPAAPED